MLLNKLTVINQLMAEGEEDAAVLLARSAIPDTIDTRRDLPTLRAFGLDEDDLLAMLPAVTGTADRAELTPDEAATLDRTISDRWADLVATWTGAR
ncbi:hypothetical protein EDD29_3569 [Actinocorallia herbida]|uniref:Uncharacterized protein n=1 Tax=Actinocorallia herbida TaxID=58109 RepID=A0A3N1CYY7_9ACTN|nr:hypothetical protein [Actinocorallia herbida]ROO86008.1 hypothetical protein EDD29_3569 [Actinocorallia herbida]